MVELRVISLSHTQVLGLYVLAAARKTFLVVMIAITGAPQTKGVTVRLLSFVCTSSSQVLKKCFFMIHSKPVINPGTFVTIFMS